jgi:WS/DGAT/MGAT family acyltransferase
MKTDQPVSDYEKLSAQDSSFVLFERRATHMHVAALALFELGPLRTAGGGLDARRLSRYVESRLGALPHYRQKLAFAPVSGHPVWVDDEHFDLDYHVRHTALPRPGSEEELKRLVARVLSQPLDRDRPLWELWIVEGLEGDRFALLMKVHHCMVDGVAGMSLLTLLMRADRDDAIPDTEAWFPRPHPSPLRLGLDELTSRARMPVALGRVLWSALREPSRVLREASGRMTSVAEALRAGLHLRSETALNQPIGPHRRIEWLELDLAEMKTLRRKLGGTVNDVVLTIVAGATGRFLERRRDPVARLDYRVVIPVNMRGADGEHALSNRVSAFFLSLPVHERDPLARFDAVRAETARLKSSRAAEGIDFFTQLVERSGSTWLTALGVRLAARVQPYNQIVSNVPGPQEPLYVLGARLQALYPLPPLFERQGLGTAVVSYDGRLCWGLIADRDSMPDLAALARDVKASYAELRDAALGGG